MRANGVALDLALAAAWSLVLVAALSGASLARRRGVPTTYLRDLLHVGTGAWALGWPFWRSPVAPLCIVAAAAGAALLVPVLAPRVPAVARVRAALASGDEGWTGIALYTIAAAALTAVALLWRPFPAAAALLALALGDGLGGFVGRRFGRLRFRVGAAKTKTLEGSLTVALGAAAGIALAAHWLREPVRLEAIAVAAASAAVAEALAPRGTDNLLVPAAVLAVVVFVPAAV